MKLAAGAVLELLISSACQGSDLEPCPPQVYREVAKPSGSGGDPEPRPLLDQDGARRAECMVPAVDLDFARAFDADEENVPLIVDLLGHHFSWIPCEQRGVEILTCGAPQWAVPLPAGQVDDRAALVDGLQGSRGECKAFEVFVGDDLLDEWEELALLEANVLFEQLSEPIENFRLDAPSLN